MPTSALLAVIVAALGYFVDIYDLLLFSIVRMASLRDLGVPQEDLLSTGVFLINCQMAGLLLGGLLWGILGDKRGRLSVLFGSIFIYSVGNILNGFATSVDQYALLRFITGIGLAGELGAGITLVSELMPAKTRGYATAIIASVGLFGAVTASLIGDTFHWRTAYFIGGGLGLLLLLLRVSVAESGLFTSLEQASCKRGDLTLLLGSRSCLKRYLSCIAIGIPVWFGIGILVTFSPEIGRALGMTDPPTASRSVLYAYLGLVVGDLFSGVLSQLVKSRRKVILLFIAFSAAISFVILNLHNTTLSTFYTWTFALGLSLGYWAVFMTSAAEQFGTNLRATVTTTAPNFVRGSLIPMTFLFDYLKPSLGILNSATVVGGLAVVIAIIAGLSLRETYGRDLNFIEK